MTATIIIANVQSQAKHTEIHWEAVAKLTDKFCEVKKQTAKETWPQMDMCAQGHPPQCTPSRETSPLKFSSLVIRIPIQNIRHNSGIPKVQTLQKGHQLADLE